MLGSRTLCQVEKILRADNRWEMTLKNVVPSICLSQWLIAGVGERSILMLHKCDLRLFHSCVGGKNSWCICETLEGSLLIQDAKHNIFYCYFIPWLFPLEPLITGKSSCLRRYSSYQGSFVGVPVHKRNKWINLRFGKRLGWLRQTQFTRWQLPFESNEA